MADTLTSLYEQCLISTWQRASHWLGAV